MNFKLRRGNFVVHFVEGIIALFFITVFWRVSGLSRDFTVLHCCFSRRWFLEHDAAEDAGFNLTRDHARRRELYFTEEGKPPMITKPVFQSLRRREVQHPEAQCWIRRELEALLLVSDVDMLTNVVIHLAKEETGFIDRVRQELEPFLHDRAERFAQELSSFLSSGLNVKGYDDFTKSSISRT